MFGYLKKIMKIEDSNQSNDDDLLHRILKTNFKKNPVFKRMK